MSAHRACPTCKGKGTNFCHVNMGLDTSKHYWGDVQCHTCRGTGQVPEAMFRWMEAGKRCRDARVARDESLNEYAKRIGLNAADVSSFEWGRWNHLKTAAANKFIVLIEADETPLDSCYSQGLIDALRAHNNGNYASEPRATGPTGSARSEATGRVKEKDSSVTRAAGAESAAPVAPPRGNGEKR